MYEFDESTGAIKPLIPNHSKSPPMPRVRRLPCLQGKCPKGGFWNPKSLHGDALLAYQRNLTYKAVNRWPNNPIARENARIIEEVDQQIRDLDADLSRDYLTMQLAIIAAKLSAK